MSLRNVPPRVRAHIYLYYAGMVIAGIGLLGFVLSFGQVGSSAQAAIDVHEDIPVLAYASILMWLIGLGVLWYSRRTLNAAAREKMKENRVATLVGSDSDPGETADADGTGA